MGGDAWRIARPAAFGRAADPLPSHTRDHRIGMQGDGAERATHPPGP